MKKKLISSLLAVTILGTLLGITAPANAATTNAATAPYSQNVKLSVGYVDIQPTFQPKVNEEVTISANAYGGSGVYLYRFEIKDSAGNRVKQSYNKTGSVKWTPTVSGNYEVEITVIDLTSDLYNTNDSVSQFRPIYVK